MIEEYSESHCFKFPEFRLFQLVSFFFMLTPNFYYSALKFVHLPIF